MRLGAPRYVARLSSFLADSRRNCCYESLAGIKEMETADGTRIIGPYRQEGFSYIDRYNGEHNLLGREEISLDDVVVWSRDYEGGIINGAAGTTSENLYSFLRSALRNFPLDEPFKRGPDEFKEGNYVYTDVCKGDIVSFKGSEVVLHRGKAAYKLAYGGGLVKI